MNDINTGAPAETETSARDRLEGLLEQGALPGSLRQRGVKMLRRISTPTEVTFMGPSASGKSSVINMLIGHPLIPAGHVCSLINVQFGDTWEINATLENGDVVSTDGHDIHQALLHSPRSIQVCAPFDILRTISISEISSDADQSVFAQKIARALTRTDIAIWCGAGFTDADREVWANVPDHVKDHAYFILTKADELAAAGILSDLVRALQPIASEQFFGFCAVAALQGLAARKGNETIDAQKWVGSGGETLAQALRDHAERGKRDEHDSAEAFVAQFAHIPERARPVSRAIKPEAQIAPSAAKPKETPAEFQEALSILSSAANSISSRDSGAVSWNAAEVLERCLTAATELSGTLDQSNEDLDPILVDEVEQAVEMMTLLQLEGGEGPAADAVQMLCQINDELEMACAA